MKLTELHVEGFRSLVNITLPMRDLMVVIGPNGSGKTALLEVFMLLQKGAEGELVRYLSDLGGLHAVSSQLASKTDRLNIHVQAIERSTGDGPPAQAQFDYRFTLEAATTGYRIPSERLTLTTSNLSHSQSTELLKAEYDNIEGPDVHNGAKSPEKKDSLYELALATHRLLSIDQRVLRSFFSRFQLYGNLDIGRRSPIRLPQLLTPYEQPNSDGGNLYSTLYTLQENEPATYKRIIGVLQQAFPGFRRLIFPVVGAGQVTLGWVQDNLSGPLFPNQLSEGTLRFLWLTTILLSPMPPPVILIDEPEVSLHPQLILLLASLLEDASARCQVVVATHSPELIRWLKPENIVVADKDEAGVTTFTWADQLGIDYETWLKEFTLSDMWLLGALGGRT